MKKIIILLTALLATPALANTIAVHNLSNRCFCKETRTDIVCKKSHKHHVTVEFGIIPRSGNSNFAPTNPPTIVSPGDDASAPITNTDGWTVSGGPGVAFMYNKERVRFFIATFADLQHPQRLIIINYKQCYDDYTHPAVFNAAWLNPNNCKYKGP